MATSLKTIQRLLTDRKWNHEVDQQRQLIITGVKATHVEQFMIVLRLTERGEFLQFCAPQLLTVKDHVFMSRLFMTMNRIAYEKKMIRFEYDPTDGEVRASIELPLLDTPLTRRQFNRCLDGLIYLVDEVAMPRFQVVLQTGNDPGDRTADKALAAHLLDQIPPELLALMVEMANEQQQEDS